MAHVSGRKSYLAPDASKPGLITDQGLALDHDILASSVKSLIIGGATGSHGADVNGVFKPTGSHNSKPVFSKEGDPGKKLFFYLSADRSFWLVSDEKAMNEDSNVGWACSEDTDADDPLSVKGWKVYLGAGRMEAQKLAVTQEVRYP